jgi:hypothetical protein
LKVLGAYNEVMVHVSSMLEAPCEKAFKSGSGKIAVQPHCWNPNVDQHPVCKDRSVLVFDERTGKEREGIIMCLVHVRVVRGSMEARQKYDRT